MARQYYKDSTTGQMKPIGVKVEDTLPVGTEVDYDGTDIPEGWVDIGNGKIKKEYQVIPTNAKLENGDSTSATNGYTAEYINDHSVVVSATEPSGSARKKVWKQTLEQDISGLYNKNTRNVNYYVNSENGELVSNGSNDATDYIDVRNYKSIIITNGVNNDTYAFYDKNKTFIRGGNYTNGIAINVINAVYIRITVKKTVVDTISISAIQNISKEYILNNGVYEEFNPQNEIYSTEEVRIGTWIDGKPLYRKIIDFGALPNNTDKSVALGISNLELIITMNGVANRPGGNKMPIPTVSSTLSGMIYIYIDASLNLHIVTGEDRSSYTKTYITIEYTKTTDD